MKIGVIGIGEIGGTIARRLSENGHSVRIANSRGPDAVKRFAGEIGARPTDVYGAVEGAEVVLLSMPFPAAAKLPRDLFDQATDGVTVVDTANYYPDVRDPASRRSTPECLRASGYRGSLGVPSSRRSTVLCSTPSPNWGSP